MSQAGFWTGLVVAGALFYAPCAQAAECHFERTLGVSGNGALDASTGSGDVKVVSGDNSHVHIRGYVRSTSWFGSDGAEVQHICDQPPVEQNGSNVKVGHLPSNWLRQVRVDYQIEVPRGFAVSAGSGSGDVELHDLGGAVTGITGSGNVRVSNLQSGAKLGTGSGDIEADGLGGNAKLETGSGTIHARFVHSGDVLANTGSGDIRLENVEGGLRAQTGSGDVEASGRPRAAWDLNTSSGGVKLHVPQGTGFTLDAGSASGDIQTTLPLTLEGGVDKHHVHGQIAGGGPEVHVGTASGDIRID